MINASRASTVIPNATNMLDQAEKRIERLIKPIRYSVGFPTQREMDGSRLKKYSQTKVWSAIRMRWDAPNQPSDSSVNRNPKMTVAKYQINAHASSVSPMG